MLTTTAKPHFAYDHFIFCTKTSFLKQRNLCLKTEKFKYISINDKKILLGEHFVAKATFYVESLWDIAKTSSTLIVRKYTFRRNTANIADLQLFHSFSHIVSIIIKL